MLPGADSNHSLQPLFDSITSRFPWVSGGFLERRIPGQNGKVTLRKFPTWQVGVWGHFLESNPASGPSCCVAGACATNGRAADIHGMGSPDSFLTLTPKLSVGWITWEARPRMGSSINEPVAFSVPIARVVLISVCKLRR